MNEEKKKIELRYKISRILTTKFLFFEISPEELSKIGSEEGLVEAKLNLKMNIDKDKGVIDIDVNSKHIIVENKQILFEHTCRTSFSVTNLNEAYDDEKDMFMIPDNLIQSMHALSYSHARALLNHDISPTMYKDRFMLPIIDMSKLVPKKE